jgi:hypothetical protein
MAWISWSRCGGFRRHDGPERAKEGLRKVCVLRATARKCFCLRAASRQAQAKLLALRDDRLAGVVPDAWATAIQELDPALLECRLDAQQCFVSESSRPPCLEELDRLAMDATNFSKASPRHLEESPRCLDMFREQLHFFC